MNPRFPWPDERLIKAAQNGDVTSLATVVVQSQPHVRKFARSLCASPQDAEDAAQEALIILYRKIGTLRATGALASWMFRIVRNECLRQVRLLAARSDASSAGPATSTFTATSPSTSTEPSAEEAVLHRLEAERIAAALCALPADQQRILIMRDVQGLPGKTVARALGLSTAAMKSRLHRARAALRDSLTATDPDDRGVGRADNGTGGAAGRTGNRAGERTVGRPARGDL